MTYFILPDAVRVDSNSQSKYEHRFGGVPTHKINDSNYKKLRMHCLYLLDTDDPLLPKITTSNKFLPLYYPLFNNACDFAYQILNDQEIKVHLLGQKKEETDFPYENYPEVLPEQKVNLISISYEEQKTLVNYFTAFEYMEVEYISDEDKNYVTRSKWPFTQIGGIQYMTQGVPEQECPNKSCKNHHLSNMHEVFAVVWNNPLDNFSIWGEYGEYSQLIFQICPDCETIYVCNRCD